ncbi:MAG: MBL fold metallo-hydrolase [Proteobacteria bacterium]|nr:MBL fold metallo-hydrolase [Pseudomonadota bacterium]
MLIFRQLFDQESSTYTYLLGDSETNDAVMIDSVYEQAGRDRALLDELGLQLRFVLDTHCHADHVTGAWVLKRHTGAKIGVSHAAGVEGADLLLVHGQHITFGSRYLEVRETPGHTNGCVTFVLDDETLAFTGDTLLIRGCGRTDFQQGDARTMYRSIQTQILALPERTKLYPAHDYKGITMTSVAEEKKFNPRLGGQISEQDFVGYMDNLGLPHPKQIDIAVPANLRCGRPENDEIAADNAPTWAPLKLTFAGLWEMDPQWLEENLNAVQILDVRETNEFCGPLGHIKNALHIPLGELAKRSTEIDPAIPVVAVCRAGARSAQAIVLLKRAGLVDCANLAGGMLRWRDRGYPVIGGVN